MLGEAYFKLDNFDEAERWYLEALKVKSDHVPAHLTYGKLLARMVSKEIFPNKDLLNLLIHSWI